MSPVARKLDYHESNMYVKNLSSLLNHLSKQSRQIENTLSLKVNEEILQIVHKQHDQIITLKSLIRTLERELN